MKIKFFQSQELDKLEREFNEYVDSLPQLKWSSLKIVRATTQGETFVLLFQYEEASYNY